MTGLAYMLQGGSDASNTDPFATAPAPGEEWVTSPPHVMILLPGEIDLTAYSTDHAAGGPYVMWAGTPYEHIMMLVAEHAAPAVGAKAIAQRHRPGRAGAGELGCAVPVVGVVLATARRTTPVGGAGNPGFETCSKC